MKRGAVASRCEADKNKYLYCEVDFSLQLPQKLTVWSEKKSLLAMNVQPREIHQVIWEIRKILYSK